MIDIREFKGYLKIDKGALDNELMHQPELLFAVSEAYAEASAHRDAMKEALAMADAGLDARIREQFKATTEAQVKSKIQVDEQHAARFSAYLTAKFEADQLAALKESFTQRGYMLRDLCQLHTTGYFESNAVRSDANSDAVAYKKRRERVALARDRR